MNRFLPVSLVFALLTVSASAQLIISEFMADNKNTLADQDGEFTDWIEIYNTQSTNVNLAGWALTDKASHLGPWYFPATNLTAKGFLVVFASGKNRAIAGGQLHTDFNLKASGEYLALLRPDGSAATEFNPFPEQFPDVSYGYAQTVVTNAILPTLRVGRVLVPSNDVLGLTWTQTGFADSNWVSAASAIGFQTAVAGFAVSNFISSVAVNDLSVARSVITNASQQLAVYSENAPVINYVNTGGGAHYANDMPFPGLPIGPDQNDFVIHATATITIPAAGSWTFGVNSDDGFGLSIGSFSMSAPSPRGPTDSLQTFVFPSAGDYPLDLVYYERGGGAEVELFAAQGALSVWSTSFKLVGDSANGGLAVQSPVVGTNNYNAFINSDIQAQMSGINSSVFYRLPFAVLNPSTLQSLTLRVRYDDGFIAYLNGQKVAERNAPATPLWNSTATNAHPNAQAVVFEPINISDRLNVLHSGQNILAIQGLNQSANDNDFLLGAELIEYKATNSALSYFATPTPGSYSSVGYVAFVSDTKFSTDRGFYDTPFSLSITTATANATIIYTTNGSTPSLSNGFVYSAPITINGTTVIRAAAFKTGFLPSDVDTQSYIFVNDVIRQSPTGATPPGWPATWGANVVDYGMDPDVVNNPAYASAVTNGLKSIPTYSLVTDSSNLFDSATGIYANAGQDGSDWERPASIELIYPSGTKGFQVNAGIRIRGGFSRSTSNPKHAFRFFFRQEYGASKLNYPAFANQNGADSFDGFDLRTFENYSWSFLGDYRFIALRDQFSRDTAFAQGQPTERGDFYHLFINGQYWGLYDTDERPEASYGETYFGGVKDDYDVVKVDTGASYTIFATDGNLDAWTRLWQAATNGFAANFYYYRIQGLNANGTPNPAYENLLDVDNLIDYMLDIFFTGNIDAPLTQFAGNNSVNNFYAVRNRTGQFGGFRFFLHDCEHTLLHESSLPSTGELYRDRTGPFPAGDPVAQGAGTAFANSNPQYIFTRLMDNAEFRLRVADHVQKEFFNGGVLTTEACRARLLARSNEVYEAIADESARWGDAKSAVPLTRNNEWLTEFNRVYGDYFANRPSIVLTQLQNKALFPTTAVAPTFNQLGGNVADGFQLSMTTPAGVIYYTRDGTDPRLIGGAISPSAFQYSGPLTLASSTRFKARTRNGVIWSPLTDATFYIIRNYTNLLITEVMYHPPGTTNIASEQFEFVELKNVSGTTLDLSGIYFTGGINYTSPVGTLLPPGQFAVLVHDPSAFTNRYPGVPVFGTFTGKLSNSGETLSLVHVTGAPIFSVNYGTRPPWPASADGTGFSIVPVNPNLNPDPNNAANWRASSAIGGSPGLDDPAVNILPIYINEALTHTDPPQLDSVELYNPNSTNVDISNWYLTDDRTVPQKFRIPNGTSISANSYRVFTENDWNANPNSSNSFRLDSHGEEIYLYSADTNGSLTGFSDGFSFGAARNGVSFGRYIISTGQPQYPAQVANTLGALNAGPRVGPVVINEINYHPAFGGDEFIELLSITNVALPLYDPAFPTNTWRLNGVGFNFPTNTTLAPHGLLLIVAGEPATFRTKYAVPGNVPIFGPYPGSLQGNGETLSLQFPDQPDFDTNTSTFFIPYIDMDVVQYDDKSPWPTNADGYGSSLERLSAAAYGNDPINWRASPGAPSPGFDNLSSRPPSVYAGPDQAFAISNVPYAFSLEGSATPGNPGTLIVQWSQLSGPAPVWFDNAAQSNTTVHFPGAGTYVLRLTANDAYSQASDEVTILLQSSSGATTQTNLVAFGSSWKYLDNGSDQGTAWRSIAFSDIAWQSGPGPLGYGDANGVLPATTIGYGPDPNNKYVTTYFRRAFAVSDPASLTNLIVNVQRDDGILLYLNGTPIFTNNMPNPPISYLTYASTVIGGSDETNVYSQPVPNSLLIANTNVLAAELHQANASSSDLFFDLQLTATQSAPNQAPVISAGPDLGIALPMTCTLLGSASDDGLPSPPALLSIAWSQRTGPGTVMFNNSNAPVTTVTFSELGAYRLRLSGNDGSLLGTDDVTITVTNPPPPQINFVDLTGLNPRSFRLTFTALAGMPYTVQYRDSLTTGSWQVITNVPALPATQVLQILDPINSVTKTRFYRVSIP